MKKRILVYWDYRRKDLLLPFEKLSDAFEFYFIFFRYKDEDPVLLLGNRIYWSDFKSPHELLKKLGPHSIIFSDLSSLYAISLNIACKSKGVTTYLLEHGVKLDYRYYLKMEVNTKALESSKLTKSQNKRKQDKWQTFFFYFSSIKKRSVGDALKIIMIFYRVLIEKSDNAFAKSKFRLRCPDKYLLFSKQNFSYYQIRDGITEDNVIYFGNPYQDDYIQALAQAVPETECPYYLLLDEGQIETFGISLKQKNAFIEKLNLYALSQKADLIVKLHPMDYGRPDLYQHSNIRYVEATDVSKLILNAKGCFAISTTLMFPLIPYGSVIIFRVMESEIQDVLVQYGVRFLDYLNFEPKEIDFSNFLPDDGKMKEFVENFLYKNDGQSTLRLKCILENT